MLFRALPDVEWDSAGLLNDRGCSEEVSALIQTPTEEDRGECETNQEKSQAEFCFDRQTPVMGGLPI